MLVDSSVAGQTWEQIASSLAALVSHVCYYWAAHQRELTDVQGQLKLSRERVKVRRHPTGCGQPTPAHLGSRQHARHSAATDGRGCRLVRLRVR